MATKLYIGPSGSTLASTLIRHANYTTNLSGVLIGDRNRLQLTGGASPSHSGPSTTTGPVTYPGVTTSSFYVTDIVDSEVTISGTVTFGFNCYETSMTANAAIGYVVWVLRKNSTWAVICDKNYGTEAPTSATSVTTTVTPTNTTLYPGDRIAVGVYADDASGATMGSGEALWYESNGTNSYVTFAENISFTSIDAAATGTTTKFLADASDVAGSGKKKMWTDAVSAQASYTVLNGTANTRTQWTETSGGTALEWYTPPLAAVTLHGRIDGVLRGTSTYSYYALHEVKIFVTEVDGSNPVQIGEGACYTGSFTTTEQDKTFKGIVSGSVSEYQRLKVVIYEAQSSSYSGQTSTLVVESSTTASSITWPTTLSAPAGVVVPPIVIETAITPGIWESTASVSAGASFGSSVGTKRVYPDGLIMSNSTYNEPANKERIINPQRFPIYWNTTGGEIGNQVVELGSMSLGRADASYGNAAQGTVRAYMSNGTNHYALGSASSGDVSMWVTPPLKTGVTIAGTISYSVSASENVAGVNGTVGVLIYKFAPDGTWSIIALHWYGPEVALSQTTYTFSGTPTSTVLNPGDVIGLLYVTRIADGASFGTGDLIFVYYGNANTWVQFTEELDFVLPNTGTVSTLTGTNSTLDTGAGTKKILSINSEVAHSPLNLPTYTGTTSPTAPVRATLTSGGAAVEWYTGVLSEVTLVGLFSAEVRMFVSSDMNATAYFDVFKTNADGSNPVQIGQGGGYWEATTGGTTVTVRGQINGSLTAGQRLMVRLCVSSAVCSGQNSLATYSTATFVIQDSTYPTKITWPAILNESAGTAIIPPIIIDVAADIAWVTQSVSVQTATIAAKTNVASGSGGTQVINRYVYFSNNTEYWPTSYRMQVDYDAGYAVVGGLAVRDVLVMYNNNGTWEIQEDLSDYTSPGDIGYGSHVHIDGTTIAVTAPSTNWFNTSRAGAVYIWNRSGSSWTETQRIAGGSTMTAFGSWIHLDGNYLAVRNNYGEDGYGWFGAVMVYYRASTTFALQQTIYQPTDAYNNPPQWENSWGRTIFLDGDTMVVAHPEWATALSQSPRFGAWFFYTRSGTTWTNVQTILPSSVTGVASGDFHYADGMYSVNTTVLRGDTFICGRGKRQASYYESNCEYIHVWKRSGGTWSFVQEITRPDTDPYFSNVDQDQGPNISLSPDETQMYMAFPRSNEYDTQVDVFGDPKYAWGVIHIYEWSGTQYVYKNKVSNPEYGVTSNYANIGVRTVQDPNNADQIITFGSSVSSTTNDGQIYTFNPAAFGIKHDSYSGPETIYSITSLPAISIGGEQNATVALSAGVSNTFTAALVLSATSSLSANAELTATAEVIKIHNVTASLEVDVSSTSDANTGTVHEVTVSLSVDVSSNATTAYIAGATALMEVYLNPEVITTSQNVVFGATVFMEADPYLYTDDYILHAPPANDTPATATPASTDNNNWSTGMDGQDYYSFEDPSWTDQASWDEDEPGSIQQRTVWWTIEVGETTSYEVRGWAEGSSNSMKFAIYDASKSLVAESYSWATSQPRVQITLRPGTYYIQGWTTLEGGDALYIDLIRAPFVLMSEWYNPSAITTYGLWGPHLIRLDNNVALATYSEWTDEETTPPYSQWGYARAVAVRVNKEDLTATVGTPMTVWTDDFGTQTDIHEILMPFHVGYGVCVIPEWVEAENLGYEGWDVGVPIAHVIRVNTETLDIDYLGVLEYSEGYPEAVNNDTYFNSGFGDGKGRGVFFGNKYYHWITATETSWSVTTSPIDSVWGDGEFLYDLVDYELPNGVAWIGNKIITVDSIYTLYWGDRIKFDGYQSWNGYTRDGLGHVLDKGGSADILIATYPTGDSSYEYHIRQGVTDDSGGTLVHEDNQQWIDSNYFAFFDSDKLIFACKNKWIYSRVYYLAPNTGDERIHYWNGVHNTSYQWNSFTYPRQNEYWREFGTGLVGFDNGTFLMMWLGYEPGNGMDERAFFRVGAYPCGEKPLKLSQRDDDLVAGGTRIGYDPQNNSTIRAGWVAW
jgi:hypothetical protein